MSQRKRKPKSQKIAAPVADNGSFYRAFEEQFRGSRTLIKARLEVYLPFVKLLLEQHQPAKVLDLGCGRGEWLELMRENGFEVEGVDLDVGMLQACAPLDLKVVQGDAIDFLKKKEDASHSVISAFHLVEHISFERLNELTAQALRVLKPGGMLILETPNPENLVVATSSFYLDPTHERPIPPPLLAFVPEYKGFKRTKILRLQESEDLSQNPAPGLLAVLNGVSPDYAVIAQKAAPQKILAIFDEVFSREYGLSLKTLADRCDARQQQTQEKAGQAETRAGHAEAIARQALDVAHRAEAFGQRADEQLRAIYSSRSWRITQPLRSAAKTVRWFKRGSIAWLTFAPHSRPWRTLRLALMHLKLYVASRPWLKRALLKCLKPFPRLELRLRQLGVEPVVEPRTFGGPAAQVYFDGGKSLDLLSPRARQVYHDLKAAMQKHQKDQG